MVREIKRISALLIIMLILIMCLMPIRPAWGASQHMYDPTGLMTDSELAYCDNYLAEMSENLGFDLVGVLIQEGYDGDGLRDFADDFYDYGGYGYGAEKDGAIFVVDWYSRQMTLVTTGYGITAVTDYGENLFYDKVTSSLQNSNFSKAFTSDFADTMEYYVYMANRGTPVDVNNEKQAPDAETLAGMGGVAAAVGAGAGLASSQRQKAKLKSVRKKTQANSYARRDSLVLTRKQDMFLYSTIAVSHHPRNDDQNNRQRLGGGGGTTIHMGSSGVPHGGGHSRGF